MNPHGTELGWAVVAGEDALHPSWGCRDVLLGHWDGGRMFLCMSLKAFEVSLVHSVGEVEGTMVILHPGRAPAASQGGFVGMWEKLRRRCCRPSL